MSGPIVRKYGFSNFEKIFGEKPIQHGLDEADQKKADEEKAKAKAEEAAKKPS